MRLHDHPELRALFGAFVALASLVNCTTGNGSGDTDHGADADADQDGVGDWPLLSNVTSVTGGLGRGAGTIALKNDGSVWS